MPFPKGSRRDVAVQQAADGSSHLSTAKRFDNIFASRDVRIAAALVDQTPRASDHPPVMAGIRCD